MIQGLNHLEVITTDKSEMVRMGRLLSGRNGKHAAADVIYDRPFIEVELKKRHTIVTVCHSFRNVFRGKRLTKIGKIIKELAQKCRYLEEFDLVLAKLLGKAYKKLGGISR